MPSAQCIEPAVRERGTPCSPAVSSGALGLRAADGLMRAPRLRGAALAAAQRRAAPGGRTSASARAGVEQYSPRPTGQLDQLGGHPARAPQRRGSFSRRPRCRREPDDHPEHCAAPERHHEHRPDPDPASQPSAAGSRTARAGRGPSSAARPWRSIGCRTNCSYPTLEEWRWRTPRRLDPRARQVRQPAVPEPRDGRRGQRPAAARSASALSVRSQVKSGSSRPKWP